MNIGFRLVLAVLFAWLAMGASLQSAWSASDSNDRRAREIEKLLTTISGHAWDGWTKFDYVFKNCEARVLAWTRKDRRLPFERYQKSGEYLFTVKMSGIDLARTRKRESRSRGGVYAPCTSAACMFREGRESIDYKQKTRLAGSLISKRTKLKPGLFVKGRLGSAGKIHRLLVELADKCRMNVAAVGDRQFARTCFAEAAGIALPKGMLWLSNEGRVLGIGRTMKGERADYRIVSRPGGGKACVDPRSLIGAFETQRRSWLSLPLALRRSKI